MRLKITHKTVYSYDTPVHYALQQLRLTPRSAHGQNVLNWSSTIVGGAKQVEFNDTFMNLTELVKVDDGATRVEITSQGEVETEDRNGVIGPHHGFAPLWLYQGATDMTRPGQGLRAMARRIGPPEDHADALARLHATSAQIAEEIRYETGRTDSDTTAEVALATGVGVCQDHAHVMITLARLMGHPARYVSGYLMMDGQDQQEASHAWCEIWTETLGWVGFDVSNGISPDARYVRVAIGRDYRDAAPILGLRQGAGTEALHVSLQVQQ